LSNEAEKIRLLPSGNVITGVDFLLDYACVAVDIMQAVVLYVEGVPAEAGAVGEQHHLSAQSRDVH
jgi:hypothetical protein